MSDSRIDCFRALLPLIVAFSFVVGFVAATAAREPRAMLVGFGASVIVGPLVWFSLAWSRWTF